MKNKEHTISIDISDRSVKVLLLSDDLRVKAYGRGKLQKGVVQNGFILDNERFSEKLSKVLHHTKPTKLRKESEPLKAIISLPESRLITYYFNIPASVSNEHIRKYVEREASQLIPFELERMYWDYLFIDGGDIRDAIFVGAERDVVDKYVESLERIHIEPIFLGGELFSLGRALLTEEHRKSGTIIVDMGARTTDIGVFDKDGVVRLSVTLSFGGEYITETLAEKLGVNVLEAERLKTNRELSKEYAEDVLAVVKDVTEELMTEVDRVAVHFKRRTKIDVKNIILTGGTALLPYMLVRIEELSGISTSVANPFVRLKDDHVFDETAPPVFFANVIGLALRGRVDDVPAINLLEACQRCRAEASQQQRKKQLERQRFEFKRENWREYGSITFAVIAIIALVLVLAHFL